MTGKLPRIIFVPGIRAKPPAEQQLLQLQRCLDASLHRSGYAEPQHISAQLELIGWSHSFYGEHADIGPDLPGIEALLANAGDPALDRAEANSVRRRVVAGLYAIGDRFPLVSRVFATHRMETRLREINRYFSNVTAAGDLIREMLIERLQVAWSEQRPVVLMGHSFGSVIAYDALWELSHRRNSAVAGQVDLFVTLGSPLTMRYIRRRLQGAGQRGRKRYPTNIVRWHNLAACGEVTALDRRMADCFGEMQTLGLVESITDNLQVLNRFRGPDGLNVHKCYGYLASDAVAAELMAFWAEQSAVTA